MNKPCVSLRHMPLGGRGDRRRGEVPPHLYREGGFCQKIGFLQTLMSGTAVCSTGILWSLNSWAGVWKAREEQKRRGALGVPAVVDLGFGPGFTTLCTFLPKSDQRRCLGWLNRSYRKGVLTAVFNSYIFGSFLSLLSFCFEQLGFQRMQKTPAV